MVTTTATLGPSRSVPVGCFGVNGADVKTRINMWNDPNYLTTVQALGPNLIRYAGGTTANYWRYRTSKTDTSWAGYTTDGGKNSDGTPQTLTLQRFKDVCTAAGATPVFDLNIACDAAVFGNSFNKYDCKPYGLPNLTETLAFLNAAADIGLPITYLELGNELPSFNDPQVKTNYAFALQASGKSDPVTGVPYTLTSFPAGMVWDWNAIPTAPGTLNSNGQDEFYLSLGQAMTGFPAPADVPGLGGGGGGWLYGVRCSQWIKAIKSWATGRGLPTPKFLVCVANKPTGGPGPTSKKYWNQGLAHGLDTSGPGVPDYFVLHPYWSTDISYTYGQPTPSIDPNNAGYSTDVEDAYLYAPMEGTATAADGDLIWQPPGADGSVGLQFYYSLQPLVDRGMRLANTEFGQLEQETIVAPPGLSTGGVDSGHGGFGQMLTQITSLPYRLEVVPLDIATIHCISGNVYVSAAFTNGTGGFKPNTLYSYGFNTPRSVGTVTITGNKVTVSDGSLTGADVQARLKVNGLTGTIFSIQSGTAATLTGSPGDTSGSGTVEPAMAHPQFRMAGAAFPLPGPPSISWNKSASGWSMLVLNRCTRSMDTFYPLAFSGSPTLADSGAGTAYRGLVGGYWTNSASKKTAVITHLRRDSATVTLPSQLVGLPAVILSASHLAVPVTQQSDFNQTALTTTSTVTLPPHSALYINSGFTSPAALVADMADPSVTVISGGGGAAVQLATTDDLNAAITGANTYAVTQANAAKAASIPLTTFAGKGSIPIGSAPNTAGHLDVGASPDGYVLKTSAAASTGLAWAANSMSGLSDAGASMGVYSGTGSIGSGSSILTDGGSPNFTDAMSNRVVTITSGGAGIGLPGCTFTAKYKAANQLTLTYLSGNGGVNPLPAGSFQGSIVYTVAMADQVVPTYDLASGRWLGRSPGTNKSVVGVWQANTGYQAGQVVISPAGLPVSAIAAFTSGSTYDSTKWTYVGAARQVIQWSGSAWPTRPAGLPNGLAEYVGPASATNPTDMTVGDTLVLGG